MLLKMSIKKIMVATVGLVILLMIYLIPSNDAKEVNFKNSDIEYVYENTLETIYLLDKDNYVARTSIKTCNCSIDKKARELIEGLIIEGTNNDLIPNGFRSIIPSGTSILDLSISDNNARINFSKDILDVNENDEEAMLEAIIYTLTSLDGIDTVTILVEGNYLTNLPHNHKNVNIVLDKSYGINKMYDITTFNNVSSYNTYYVNKYNDDYYYVPVTRYLSGDKEDKIKLIIEQLSTSPRYQSNLMTFLNNNIKLLNYELTEDNISLNFNNYILSDVNSSNILEEVIYTICLSLYDEYNIKDVVFNVENKKIMEISLKTLDKY